MIITARLGWLAVGIKVAKLSVLFLSLDGPYNNGGSVMVDISAIQVAIRKQEVDAWLLYDFRGSNPVFRQILSGPQSTTRRVFCMIPAIGEPVLLVSPLDSPQFHADTIPSDLL